MEECQQENSLPGRPRLSQSSRPRLGAFFVKGHDHGNETVLDAIAQIQGLEQVSSKKIWVARPSRTTGNVRILPVDWFAITESASPHTNYQILPGDRVFIAEDKWVAWDTRLAKLTAPFERIMGFTLLSVGTATRLSGPVLQGGGNPNNSGF